jgi:hypothetical protein
MMKWICLSDESIQRRQPNHPEVASILLLLEWKIPQLLSLAASKGINPISPPKASALIVVPIPCTPGFPH